MNVQRLQELNEMRKTAAGLTRWYRLQGALAKALKSLEKSPGKGTGDKFLKVTKDWKKGRARVLHSRGQRGHSTWTAVGQKDGVREMNKYMGKGHKFPM